MMLELILTRISDQSIKESIYKNLRFLVFDELHTYRGRQGADVALLIRRIKSSCQQKVTCIGTSATMVSGGSIEDQKREVAKVGETLFGIPFSIQQIIGEKLKSSFGKEAEMPPQKELKKTILQGINVEANEDKLKKHAVALWLENRIALSQKEGISIRNEPYSLEEIVNLLHKESRVEKEKCEEYIESLMKWISEINRKREQRGEKRKYLPFKLHQFISQTGCVYITLEKKGYREITLEPGIYKQKENQTLPLFPVVFSRRSGASFICATLNMPQKKIHPRKFNGENSEKENALDVYIFSKEEWNPEEDVRSLPDTWLKIDRKGNVKVEKSHRDRIPQKIYFDKKGNFSQTEEMEYEAWYMPTKLLFDPSSGTFYDTKTSERTKLTQLGNEGRSTSTTITSFCVLKALKENGFKEKDQKLLSFSDNRQDAALQSGHFNDYICVIRLRSAIYKAIQDSSEKKLTYKNLSTAIFHALNLKFTDFANEAKIPKLEKVRRKYESSLQKYLMYRTLYDLRRSWRVILPNLEQCGLLKIEYEYLDEFCSQENIWQEMPILDKLAKEKRKELIRQILDYFRSAYAIHSENFLSKKAIEENKKEIKENLRSPWKFEEKEEIHEPCYLRFTTIKMSQRRLFTQSIGRNSQLGKYIQHIAKKEKAPLEKGVDYIEFIEKLLDILQENDYLISESREAKKEGMTKIYQLKVTKLIWALGDQTSVPKDISLSRGYKEIEATPNSFFQKLYLSQFPVKKHLVGGEHTAQLNNDDRKDRESKFRVGKINALFCSPTMELGIDIKNLSVVHMRNTPPNPANYTQRSGRAGRSGQGALVFTYCSSYSSHDRHYFEKAKQMVAGSVAAPRIDLVNEELIHSHLNALFLSEIGLHELQDSIQALVNTENSERPMLESIAESLQISEKKRQEIQSKFEKVLSNFKEKKRISWYHENWIENNLERLIQNLDKSLDRWRNLYKSAKELLENSTNELKSGVHPNGSKENKLHKSNQFQAQRQLDVLRNERTSSNYCSEFYRSSKTI